MAKFPEIRSTTILAVRKGEQVAIGGDGQVSLGPTVIKSGSKKIRTLMDGTILVGFAGATADALSLLERLEGYLKDQQGNLLKSAIELAKQWRTDRMLRRLECMMIALDKDNTYLLSGSGDVIEPDDGIIAIGSGGNYAMAAARALIEHSELEAKDIVEKSLKIASQICVYTNDQFHIETL